VCLSFDIVSFLCNAGRDGRGLECLGFGVCGVSLSLGGASCFFGFRSAFSGFGGGGVSGFSLRLVLAHDIGGSSSAGLGGGSGLVGDGLV